MADWLISEDETLINLWKQGHSTAEIGRRLGRSKNSIVGRSHRLNLSNRPSPIRPAGSGVPQAIRRAALRANSATLPPLASLSAPAHNANAPPPADKRADVVRLLTQRVSNVDTSMRTGVKLAEVRKIRKAVEVQKRKKVSDGNTPRADHKKKGEETPKVFEGMEFGSTRRAEIYYGSREAMRPIAGAMAGDKFIFGKKLDVRRPAGIFPSEAAIAAHIAQNGVKQCPAAAVAYTTASIPDQDRLAVAAYRKARDEEWAETNAPRLARSAAASKRAAMRR